MNWITKCTIANCLFMVITSLAHSQQSAAQHITKAQEHTLQQAPTTYFSGNAQFSRYPVLPSSGDVAPAIVHFEANSITNWHIHSQGQYLIVTEGEGLTQEWGKPLQRLQKGDIVWCEPGVKHWHGASEHQSMTHIAISPIANDGKNVTWLEKVELPTTQQPENNRQHTIPSVTLTAKQLNIIPIAAFTASGNLEKLKPALVHGLNSGLSVNEVKEIFAHQYAYAGFPRALNGMLAFRNLLQERQQQGIEDIQGALPTPLADNTDYYQAGNHTLAYLRQSPLAENTKPLFDNFSPTMDYALKAHLFGYLFSRDNLSYLERELVVVGTLSVLGEVNPQLRSHLRITKNLGVDLTQMQRVVEVLEKHMGSAVARNTESVLQQI